MKNNSNTNKEEKNMEKTKKVIGGMKKVFKVLTPLALITGGAFLVKAALTAVGAEDAAEAIDEMGEEIAEAIEEEVE